MNVLALAVTQGLNGALESFVSQAYGFGKYKMCGAYLNRGRAIVTVILIPIAILLSISDKLLISI
jgi:Na+-driven multidrug efflux pump